MADPDTSLHGGDVPKVPSGRRGSGARSKLPHDVSRHYDIGELLRNSAIHFGGNHATVTHLKDGIGSYDALNHLTQNDASRIAHGLLGARRHASQQSRDLYTSAIHHLGYRFDERGHIHQVPGQKANFSAAMKNPAFRVHIAVENDVAADQQNLRYQHANVGEHKVTSVAALDDSVRGVEVRGGVRGVEFDGSMSRGVNKVGDMAPRF
jgi:hypothetical protein